jgi:hypothetical protein
MAMPLGGVPAEQPRTLALVVAHRVPCLVDTVLPISRAVHPEIFRREPEQTDAALLLGIQQRVLALKRRARRVGRTIPGVRGFPPEPEIDTAAGAKVSLKARAAKANTSRRQRG